MGKRKILFINQEIAPYVPDSDMSLMSRDLPQAIQEKGYEIRTFMPKWGTINERRGQLHEVIRLSGMNLIIDETDHPIIIKVASIPSTRIQVYFIDNDEYFQKRKMAADELGQEYPDNGERAVFFARGVLETIKKMRWAPDIIICQGWMAAVIPLYIKTAYHEEPSFANSKVITTLFQGSLKDDLGESFKRCVPYREATIDLLKPYKEKFTYTELGKLAIDYSDAVIEVGEKINKNLIKYVEKKGIPTLKLQQPEASDAILELYRQVCPDE